MEPVVLHIDAEKGWRGGQQQAVYLHELFLKKNVTSYFVCRKGSELEKYFIQKELNFLALPLKNELDIISAYKIAKFAKKNHCNIIHCHSSHSLSIGLLSKLFYSKPKIVGVRRVDFNIKKNFLSQWKYNSKHTSKIVCISNAIKNVMLEDGIDEDKLTVIHSAIDINKFNNSKPEGIIEEFSLQNKFVFGTVAAFTGHKDYPNLLKAISLCKYKLNDTVFLLVGKGKLLDEMKKLAESLNLNNEIVFTNFRSDIGDILTSINVFIMPSKKEGLGTSVLDAMSVGLPIISTDAGGIVEAVKDKENGIVVPKKDSQALADAIVEMYNNEEMRKEYGKKSLDLIKNFDIKVNNDRYIEFYSRLLNE